MYVKILLSVALCWGVYSKVASNTPIPSSDFCGKYRCPVYTVTSRKEYETRALMKSRWLEVESCIYHFNSQAAWQVIDKYLHDNNYKPSVPSAICHSLKDGNLLGIYVSAFLDPGIVHPAPPPLGNLSFSEEPTQVVYTRILQENEERKAAYEEFGELLTKDGLQYTGFCEVSYDEAYPGYTEIWAY